MGKLPVVIRTCSKLAWTGKNLWLFCCFSSSKPVSVHSARLDSWWFIVCVDMAHKKPDLPVHLYKYSLWALPRQWACPCSWWGWQRRGCRGWSAGSSSLSPPPRWSSPPSSRLCWCCCPTINSSSYYHSPLNSFSVICWEIKRAPSSTLGDSRGMRMRSFCRPTNRPSWCIAQAWPPIGCSWRCLCTFSVHQIVLKTVQQGTLESWQRVGYLKQKNSWLEFHILNWWSNRYRYLYFWRSGFSRICVHFARPGKTFPISKIENCS